MLQFSLLVCGQRCMLPGGSHSCPALSMKPQRQSPSAVCTTPSWKEVLFLPREQTEVSPWPMMILTNHSTFSRLSSPPLATSMSQRAPAGTHKQPTKSTAMKSSAPVGTDHGTWCSTPRHAIWEVEQNVSRKSMKEHPGRVALIPCFLGE